jgi:hypothetical protein
MELNPRSKSQLRAKNYANTTEAVGRNFFFNATIPVKKKLITRTVFRTSTANF